jgi:hypothetical protein
LLDKNDYIHLSISSLAILKRYSKTPSGIVPVNAASFTGDPAGTTLQTALIGKVHFPFFLSKFVALSGTDIQAYPVLASAAYLLLQADVGLLIDVIFI